MNIFHAGGKVLMGDKNLDEYLGCNKRYFLVCDPFLVENNGISYITDRLTALRKDYFIYSNIQPDPSVELVTEGMEALIKYGPDGVIAIGGGSAIDAAKAMVYFSKKESLIDNVSFMAIPTTSGTGSEVTSFSVITDTQKGVKYPLIDDSLLPDIAVLDAQLTLSVPPQITAATGMDVLTHAIEALVSTEANDFSDAVAEKAVKLVRSHLLNCFKDGSCMVSRQGMHNASCLAGIAFNNSGLGLNHGMAHAVGGKFHIPHGVSNAVLLPYVMGFNAGCYDKLNENAKKYAKIARLIRVDSSSIRQSALNLIRYVKRLNEQLKIPANFSAMGIDEKEFKAALDEMANNAFADRCTANNPRTCTVEDIKQIYTHAFFGRVGKDF